MAGMDMDRKVSMIEIKLPTDEWQRVLQILARAPWQEANPLIMAIGEQLRTAQLPAKHRAAGMPEAPDGEERPTRQ